MTLHELSQLYNLRYEIQQLKDRIAELESRLADVKAQQLDGMPKNGGDGRALENAVAAVADMIAREKEMEAQCRDEEASLQAYIDGIDDSVTRMIFRFRFLGGLSWLEVANCMGGKVYTETAVKMVCYRWLADHE